MLGGLRQAGRSLELQGSKRRAFWICSCRGCVGLGDWNCCCNSAQLTICVWVRVPLGALEQSLALSHMNSTLPLRTGQVQALSYGAPKVEVNGFQTSTVFGVSHLLSLALASRTRSTTNFSLGMFWVFLRRCTMIHLILETKHVHDVSAFLCCDGLDSRYDMIQYDILNHIPSGELT